MFINCDTDCYLGVAAIQERFSLKKGIKQHLVADRYNLNKLLDHQTRKEYQIDVGNSFSTLEGLEILDDTWVKSRDSIKASAEQGFWKHTEINFIRSQEKNLNQNRDSNLGPPDF